MRGWLSRRVASCVGRRALVNHKYYVAVGPLRISCAPMSSHPLNTGDEESGNASLSHTSAAEDDMLELMMQGCTPIASPAMVEAEKVTTSAAEDNNSAETSEHTTQSSTVPNGLHVLQLHNLPRNWLHEDIITFIDQVAAHAGIAAPNDASNQQQQQQDGDDEDSAMPHVHSPFVRHLRIPFGRRTGLVFGAPQLTLTSAELASYLLNDLNFDPDDYRNRIYFTRVQSEGEASADEAANNAHKNSSTYYSIEETVEAEQAEALRGLELDRYLLAPDLTLDIAKIHQRRLVTRNEKVVLDSFLDGDEDAETAGDNEAEEGTTKTPVKKTRRGSRRAGTQQNLGRGSMHNMPIPKPYIEGRRL